MNRWVVNILSVAVIVASGLLILWLVGGMVTTDAPPLPHDPIPNAFPVHVHR
jgi:hypothetical protein